MRVLQAGVVALLAGLSMSANASDWKQVGYSDEVKTFVDRASITKVGKYLKAWQMYDWNSEQSDQFNYKQLKYQSEKQLGYFSCAERTYTTVQRHVYSGAAGDGSPVHSVQVKLNPASFQEAIPDSVGEAVLNYVCKNQAANVPAKKN